MTKYLSGKAFSSPANNRNYADNYDSVFGKKMTVLHQAEPAGEEGVCESCAIFSSYNHRTCMGVLTCNDCFVCCGSDCGNSDE